MVGGGWGVVGRRCRYFVDRRRHRPGQTDTRRADGLELSRMIYDPQHTRTAFELDAGDLLASRRRPRRPVKGTAAAAAAE